ncbi:MAG: translational GTPase TypA [Kiritimatiellae bacterium]|nr:translational GTPase TypA [Kiritimatiellia bacterium]
MEHERIRNIAIIAHVDHGKTTLVDELFKQSGMFRDNQHVQERMMDSMDLERERGITITSKNGCFEYKDHLVNIIDTPGHADFGGQVERVLRMADGAILLVDAQEGPMPQTYFVLKKALALDLPIIVMINKIDKPAARPHWVVDQVFDLFVQLDASHELLDFHALYGSSRDGHAAIDPDIQGTNMQPLLDAIITEIPAPKGDPNGSLQLQVSSIDYSSFLGRLGIGKVTNGSIKINTPVVVSKQDGTLKPMRVTKLYKFEGNGKVEAASAGLGDIIAIAGSDEIMVGETFTDVDNPIPLPTFEIDPPTISMIFFPNTSPFAGKEGKYVTSTHIEERLRREILSDVALRVEENPEGPGFKVSGRGELHISILIEKMRREGYEFQVSSPKVIQKVVDGVVMEPFEMATLDVPEATAGTIIEKLGARKGQLLEMNSENGQTRLKYKIPTRGLLGFKSIFMSDTKGMGDLGYVFMEYDKFCGEIKNRKSGVLVSMVTGTTVAFALFNLQKRGSLFLPPGVNIYAGQVIGEHCRENDLTVNPAKGKQLTNVRASGTDESVTLTPERNMSLEDCIAYINDDELVEVTPKNIRIRKIPAKPNNRGN